MSATVASIPRAAECKPPKAWRSDPPPVVPDHPGPRPARTDPLHELARLGQSIWLTQLDRNLIRSGQLQQLIDNDTVSGLTGDPAALAKAVSDGDAYDTEIKRLAEAGKSREEIRRRIRVGDAREAADVLRPIYDRTHRRDGYVSVGVSPHLAHQTSASVAEAKRLWQAVDRPNVLINVPATLAGVSVVRQLLADGINVNVTVLFDLLRYREVLEAWISGVDAQAYQTASIEGLTCVVSFCPDQMDALVDPLLERAAVEGLDDRDRLWQLRGQAGVAQAKWAFRVLQQFLAGFRFARLSEMRAQPLRLLWGNSTGKNPDYSDLKYVEPLIGEDTIVSLPLDMLAAYRDHGNPALRIEEGSGAARQVLYDLPQLGLERYRIAQRLEEGEMARLVNAHDALLDAIETKARRALPEPQTHTASP